MFWKNHTILSWHIGKLQQWTRVQMFCGLNEMKCGFKSLLQAVQAYYLYPIIGHTRGAVNPLRPFLGTHSILKWFTTELCSSQYHNIILFSCTNYKLVGPWMPTSRYLQVSACITLHMSTYDKSANVAKATTILPCRCSFNCLNKN